MNVSSLATRPQDACSFHRRALAGMKPAPDFVPGRAEDGVGDPYFPGLGNPGYDAQHYTIDAKVDVQDNNIDMKTKMEAVATQELPSFNLDFQGFEITNVTVNGAQAKFKREGRELVIQPEAPLAAGSKFEVGVDYHGRPKPYHSPHAPIPLGWNHRGDSTYVLSEPDGASSWIPVNDHPTDKATYSFNITVPKPYTAAANGTLVETKPGFDAEKGVETSTFHFETREPMAPYLATVTIGELTSNEDRSKSGVPIKNYFPVDMARDATYDFGRTAEMIDFFSEKFGPYPFSSYGAAVIDASVGGAALETQTMPIFERGMVTGDRSVETVYVHELAHQWFGDSVSVKNWKDIWLNEGFATYAQWLWTEKNQGSDALERQVQRAYRSLEWQQGSPPIADPGATGLFDHNVYIRGGVTMHALRKTVGDEAFFTTLRTYTERFRNGNASTEDFIAVASEVSGQDLNPFFDKWVRQSELPALPT